ncbi:MAG: HGxxPAAW family protein [Nocardioides sp.]
MSDNHGNTPAAWSAVAVGLLAFVVGGIGLMLDPISYTVFWIGVGLGAAAIVLYLVMAKLGYNTESH